MCDHLKEAAARRMIFPVSLKVLRQMLDPAGEKCDLHIRAAGVVFMQLELLKAQRLGALCHNEGANVDEDFGLATVRRTCVPGAVSVIPMPGLFRVCRRTTDAVSLAIAPCGARQGS